MSAERFPMAATGWMERCKVNRALKERSNHPHLYLIIYLVTLATTHDYSSCILANMLVDWQYSQTETVRALMRGGVSFGIYCCHGNNGKCSEKLLSNYYDGDDNNSVHEARQFHDPIFSVEDL